MLAKYTSINKNCMTQIRQNTVLITGGASGIGKLMGSKCLQRETIAEAIWQAVEQNRILLPKPFIVNLLPFLRGILPTHVFDTVAGQWFGVYTSLNDFTGRPAAVTKPANAT